MNPKYEHSDYQAGYYSYDALCCQRMGWHHHPHPNYNSYMAHTHWAPFVEDAPLCMSLSEVHSKQKLR